MNVYIYQATLLCEACGDKVCDRLFPATAESCGWESNRYPISCPDGGGEADTPQHCDQCGLFLENPLTDQGMSYVRGKVDVLTLLEGTNPVVKVWADFYGVTL